MQLKALHEQLTAELCAATKATAAAETAAEKRAVAGAEAAKMASQDNARLRDVNVELVKALKTGAEGEFILMFVWAIGLTPCFVLRSRKMHKKRWRWPRPRRPRRLNRPSRYRISIPSSWVSFESRGDRRRRPRLRRRNPRKPPHPLTRCSKPSSRFVLTLFAHPRVTRITRYIA